MRAQFAFILALFLIGTAHAQLDNSCTYKYSFGKQDDSYFSFCLTKYGTLASLESPSGVDHLDPVNPIEGFQVVNNEDWFPMQEKVFPGLGYGELPTVVQPKGPGKLPISFYYNYVNSTVTADSSLKTVVFTMTAKKRWSDKYEFADGYWWRTAAPLVDGLGSNLFQNSAFAAFSYNPTGHGVMIDGSYTGLRFVGDTRATYNGQGYVGDATINNSVWFTTAGSSTAVFSYRIF